MTPPAVTHQQLTTPSQPARTIRPSGERGSALILSLIVLTTLSVIALFLSSSASIDRRMAGDEVTKAKALHFAEAGVNEALARIHRGEGPDLRAADAPEKVVQILNTNASGMKGSDTTLLATGQPNGEWLPYTTTNSTKNTLTIEFRTNPARTQIYKYDRTLSPPIQTTRGRPIYRITSTGVVDKVKRTIVTEVCWNPTFALVKGAFAADEDVKFTGNAISCGYDHRISTPNGTGASGRTGGGGCAEDLLASPPQWEYGTGSVAGIWSTKNGNGGGASNAFGTPATANYQSGFYAGPWEVLGMTEAAFYAWVGAPLSSLPANPNGVYYLDNDGAHQNATGDFDLVTGTGFLYVDGDLTLHADWRGLVYVEGELKLNSNSWFIGAVICKARHGGEVKFNGGATVLYSGEVIQQALTSGNRFVTLSWKESP